MPVKRPASATRRPAAAAKNERKLPKLPKVTPASLPCITRQQLKTLEEHELKTVAKTMKKMTSMPTAGACSGSNITSYGHSVLASELAVPNFKFLGIYGCESDT
jgi:hypothetical protein